MRVIRHYFISNNLNDLENIEEQLERAGISTPQIHVLSLDDTAVENRHKLNDVTSFMKTDVLRSGEIGAAVGLVSAVIFLALVYLGGWAEMIGSWLPFAFIALMILGFSTWEGGFIGIQRKNKRFNRFEQALKDGNHVFFVDLKPGQEDAMDSVISKYKSITLAGTERGTPSWVIEGQERIPRMLENI
ncbi:MAG: magnesium transporter [Pseudomonadales bacterium]